MRGGAARVFGSSKALAAMARWATRTTSTTTTTGKCIETLAVVVPSPTSTLPRRRLVSSASRALLDAWHSTARASSTGSCAWKLQQQRHLFPPPRRRIWMTTSAALPSSSPSSSASSTSTAWTDDEEGEEERSSTSLCSEPPSTSTSTSASTSASDFLVPPMRLPPGEVHIWWLLEGGRRQRKQRRKRNNNNGDGGGDVKNADDDDDDDDDDENNDEDDDDDGLFLRDSSTGQIVGPSPLLERAAKRLMPAGKKGAEEDGYLSSSSSSSKNDNNSSNNNNKTPAERARSLAARVLVRWALGRYAGVHPSSLPLARAGNGKPLLVSAEEEEEEEDEEEETSSKSTSSSSSSPPPPPPSAPCCSLLEFNLTHTEGLIGVAVSSPGFAVGLDAELWSRTLSKAAARGRGGGPLSFARKKFTPLEAAALGATPEGPRRDAEFNALWTLKEAALKATGKGIGGVTGSRLKSVEFEFVGGSGGGNGSEREKRKRRDDDGDGDDDDASPVAAVSPRAALEAAVPGLPVPRMRPGVSASSASTNPLTLLGPRGIVFRGRGEEEEEEEKRKWSFVLLAPTKRHVAALCVASSSSSDSDPSIPPPPLRVRVWRADLSCPEEEEQRWNGRRRGFGGEMPRGAAALACSLPPLRNEKKN